MINKNTKCFISIAERPGNFGSAFFNTLFAKLKMDCVYKPFQVKAEDLTGAITGLRALNIQGCGVSMPHKQKVIRHLDWVDNQAQKIGAVNTIVNKKGKLCGYNTDYLGLKVALSEIKNLKTKSVLVIGAGGVARATLVALKELKPKKIIVTNRDNKRGQVLAHEFHTDCCPFAQREEINANILVNATPVGMSDKDELILPEKTLVNYQTIIDVVVSISGTKLIKTGIKYGLQVFPGSKLTIEQAQAQFELYTSVRAPQKIVDKIYRLYFKIKK